MFYGFDFAKEIDVFLVCDVFAVLACFCFVPQGMDNLKHDTEYEEVQKEQDMKDQLRTIEADQISA